MPEPIEAGQPVTVEAAAHLLGVSDETVRKCVETGLLFAAARTPDLLLEPVRLHEVARLAQDLRALGTADGDLLDQIWYRLTDEAWLDDPDFTESLAQMARGEYSTLYPDGRARSTKER